MVFVGVQPVFTHVPPKSARSTRAVERPDLARATARGTPAWPEPRIRAENFLGGDVVVDIFDLFAMVCWVVVRRRCSAALWMVAQWYMGLEMRVGDGHGQT